MACTSTAIRSAASLSPRSAASMALPVVAVIAQNCSPVSAASRPASSRSARTWSQSPIQIWPQARVPRVRASSPSRPSARYAAAASARCALDEGKSPSTNAAPPRNRISVASVRSVTRSASRRSTSAPCVTGCAYARIASRRGSSEEIPVRSSAAMTGRSGLVLGAAPEAPGRRPEEQVDGDVSGTGVLRPVRRVDQGPKTPGVREIAERDDLADGDQASPLDRAHVGGVRQARELRRDAALAELARQLGRPEPQRTAPRRVRRELGRSPQPADPHGRRPPLKRPCRGLLELARQGLIDAHGRGRAMPELLVELVIQCSGERLVNPHALGERGRPMDRRGHQRVPEVHVRGGVDLDQSHLGGGVDRLDRQRRDRRRCRPPAAVPAAHTRGRSPPPAGGRGSPRAAPRHARRTPAPGALSAAAGPAVARRRARSIASPPEAPRAPAGCPPPPAGRAPPRSAADPVRASAGVPRTSRRPAARGGAHRGRSRRSPRHGRRTAPRSGRRPAAGRRTSARRSWARPRAGRRRRRGAAARPRLRSSRSSSAARAIRKGSADSASSSPNATSRCLRWTAPSSSSLGRSAASSWWRPAKGRCASDCTPRVECTVIDRSRACSTTASRSRDLPMPASPRTMRAPPVPVVVRSSTADRSASSSSRP